ncbi:MAG: hypothetical protein RLZZ436_405 [Planctomycetota bacterium]
MSYRPIDIDRTPCMIGSRRFNGERVLVCASACGVSGALAGHFTRGMPPCGSRRFFNAARCMYEKKATGALQPLWRLIVPGGIRTHNLRLRRPTLYPIELPRRDGWTLCERPRTVSKYRRRQWNFQVWAGDDAFAERRKRGWRQMAIRIRAVVREMLAPLRNAAGWYSEVTRLRPAGTSIKR